MIRSRLSVIFTDIVGSTAARARLGDERADELRREHDQIVTRLIEAHDGRVIKNLGDGLLAICGDVESAVSAACGAQRRLRKRNSSDTEALQIRVGISHGEVTEEDGDVFGMTVVEAARLCGLADSDQILVTQPVADEVELTVNCVLAGSPVLKGIPDPVPVSAVLWAPDAPVGLPMGATVLGSLPNGQKSKNGGSVGSVPRLLDETVGRDDEVTELSGELRRGARVVSIIGPGGSGKTRLATEVARSLRGGYDDGVWFVDLTTVAPGSSVASRIALNLELADEGTVQPAQKLIQHCAARQMLLVLDNCEHVLNDVNAVVRDFAMLAPGVQILATSTIALGVGGEIRWLCPVLDTADAVELLVARARSAGAILDAGDPNLAKACSMLDRLPLAIELVAPRLRAWTPEQLCARLTQHPRATGRAAPGTPERHRSMRALVEWSVQLLDEQQATLFRRLAVFRGSYDLESIVEVCGFDPLDPLDVDVLVADLVDHSLLRVRDDGGIRRYNLLRPIRDHAVGSLGEAESMELHSRLHRRLVAVFSDCSEKVHGPRQVEAMARFDLVLDDLRTILGPLSPVDARDRAELILKAGPYLLSAGYLNGPRSALLSAMEGAESDQKPGLLVLLARVESALDRPDLAVRAGKAALEALGSEVPPATRAEALLVTADPRSGELSPSQRLQMLDDAQDLAVQAGEAHLLAEILGSRQWALDDVGDPIGALASGEKAVSLSEQIGDIALHSLLLDGISHSYCTQGQNERAVSAAAEGLRLARQVGRRPLIGRLLGTHANALALVGDAAAAQDSAADALAIAIETGDSKLEGNARCYLAEAHLAGGAFDEALLVMLERSVDKNDSADPRKELMAAMITGWAATGANRPHVAIEALKLGLGFIQEVPGLRTRLAELGAVTAGLVSDYRLSARLLGMTSLFPEPGSAESAELTQVRAAALEALGQDEFDRQFALAQDLPVEVVLAELSEMVAGEVMA